jgi:hypothetical protein
MLLQVDYLVMVIEVFVIQAISIEDLAYLKDFTFNSLLPRLLIETPYILKTHYNNSLQILCVLLILILVTQQ